MKIEGSVTIHIFSYGKTRNKMGRTPKWPILSNLKGPCQSNSSPFHLWVFSFSSAINPIFDQFSIDSRPIYAG